MSNPVKTKVSNSTSDDGFVKKGEIMPAVNHAAETIFAKSDKAFNYIAFSFFIQLILALIKIGCQAKSIRAGSNPQEETIRYIWKYSKQQSHSNAYKNYQ